MFFQLGFYILYLMLNYMPDICSIGFFRTIMSSFSPFLTILNQNNLTSPNYVDWKRNSDIVLTANGHKFVLTDASPAEPANNACKPVRQRFDRWKRSDEMTKCYVLASVSNVLQHQLQDFDHATGMMTILKEMFGEQNRTAKSGTMRYLLNIKITESTLVREHCFSMIAILNSLEALGVEIDSELQVDIILHSLPDSYNQFRLNVTMNK
jgi:hypothetical protein